MPPPEIQHLQSDARPAFTTLAREVDWGMTAADVDPVFELGEVFGALGLRGELWAAAALFPCGDLAAIGMMMVRPSLQRRGFGRRVIDACLQALPAKTPVTLVSSPAGLGFYRRLGFVDAGTAFSAGEDLKLGYSFGLGTQLNIGLGGVGLPAIRFDYGFSPSTGSSQFHFRLGPVF